MRRPAVLLLAALMAGPAFAAPAAEPVDIPEGAVKLKGYVFRPEGPGPFPAIVAMHTCDGLGVTQGALAPLYADWGERLAAAGFVVLFPDSFGSRGLPAQCRIGERSQRSGRDRVVDADAARRWLQQQSYVVA